MNWDKLEGIRIYSGMPVDMDSPPKVGDIAKLTKDGFEFEVEITAIDNSELHGIVRRIGPRPLLKAVGIMRNELVVFQASHIQTLYRA